MITHCCAVLVNIEGYAVGSMHRVYHHVQKAISKNLNVPFYSVSQFTKDWTPSSPWEYCELLI